jgi:hypothetical protein
MSRRGTEQLEELDLGEEILEQTPPVNGGEA